MGSPPFDHSIIPRITRICIFLSLFLVILTLSDAFNIDTHAPIYKIGPHGSYFGFSVAEHFDGSRAVVLVGAPRAESGQPGTSKAGAIFSCPITATYTNKSSQWCRQEIVEYIDKRDFQKRVGMVHGRRLHYEGKNGQQLGAVVASSGVPNGIAMACAPLVRYHNTSAYTDGTCFVLESDLSQKEMLVSCTQPGLPRIDRHNEFGSCMEGFSGYVEDSMVITGLPGAKKWMGGVFARYYPKDIFSMNQDRWTMGVPTESAGIRSKFQGHDYLGFSVRHGRFGFWYEDEDNSTIVSGATRYNQTGAVTFLPFRRGMSSRTVDPHQLSLTDDGFMLLGTRLGSAFGYSLEVLDINNDGFDDLIVGAPFEYSETEEGTFGGAIYIYFSVGQKQRRGDNAKVFLNPIVIRSPDVHSQFGLSLAKLGNLDGRNNNFSDFAVGAPYADNGNGSVFIYQGCASAKDFKSKPVQVISATELRKSFPGKYPLKTFGFSLSGGADLDGNGYNDLVVGAFDSDTVVILRSRPVINVKTSFIDSDQRIDIDGDSSCTSFAKSCFTITTEVSVDSEGSRSPHLLNFDSDVFKCVLEVIPMSTGIGRRAKFVDNRREMYEWNCGRNTNRRPQRRKHKIYIPKGNNDWINPIRLHFLVKIRDQMTPEIPRDGGIRVDLNKFPMLNMFGSEVRTVIPFNKKCGLDDICMCDLTLQPVLPGISQEEDGSYVTQVGEKASIDITFVVSNKGERAYEATLFIEYNSDELDIPIMTKKDSGVNVKSSSDNLAVVELGNPMEPKKMLKFELSFKLARGKTEGLGKPLEFHAFVNSTSEEKNTDDNSWSAVVRVIKRAELELIGISEPAIVRFGGEIKGEAAMEFDSDIGPLVSHNYTITNKGPWSVRGVQLEVNWPYQMASYYPRGKWALYLLEIPRIEFTNVDNKRESRECSMALPTEWVNPLRLKFYLETKLPFEEENEIFDLSDNGSPDDVNRFKRSPMHSSEAEALVQRPIKAKKVREKSGEEIEIVQVVCYFSNFLYDGREKFIMR
ncbi:hypothetical protein AB6A40_000424 [Gnathostoma spinigerum]|uniref:Integrin alpha-2 domain-containing protein n=1 Tax=Gnathostoma spinigerum TaxID=75299 RepID=A0ABD6E234_9BILA